MDNFNWEAFTRKIAVRAKLSELYNAWTIPQELEKWFLSKALFHRVSGELVGKEENVRENDTYQWSWHLFDAIEKGEIIHANGKDQLEFTFAGACKVLIKLTQEDTEVLVTLTHSNIPSDNKSKREIRLGCDSGWSFYLVNLKSVYEGGIDLRNKNQKLKGMLNN